jgi:hypothetical protein
MIVAPIKYGRKNLLKLTPAARMATTSVLEESREVKNITAINVKRGENRLAK